MIYLAMCMNVIGCYTAHHALIRERVKPTFQVLVKYCCISVAIDVALAYKGLKSENSIVPEVEQLKCRDDKGQFEVCTLVTFPLCW